MMTCPICNRLVCKFNGANSNMPRKELDAAAEECIAAMVERWKSEGFSEDAIFLKMLALKCAIRRAK